MKAKDRYVLKLNKNNLLLKLLFKSHRRDYESVPLKQMIFIDKNGKQNISFHKMKFFYSLNFSIIKILMLKAVCVIMSIGN